MKIRRRFVPGLWLLASWMGCLGAHGQSPTHVERHGFDVASIRVNRSGSNVIVLAPSNDGYDIKNVSLQRILAIAHDLREDQVYNLPRWVTSTRFDITAKVSDSESAASSPLTWPERRRYLADVINDRFHLMAHLETKTMPVFRLELVAGEQKLQRSQRVGGGDGLQPRDDTQMHGDIIVTDRFMRGDDVPISLLAKNLAFKLGREVIDETGCKGLYTIVLQWTPLDRPSPAPGDPEALSALFTALHDQLGLRLTPGRAPVQTLVVDHVEMPSAN